MEKIDKYELIRLLGAGSMGTVYLAKDVILQRKIALKFLPENLNLYPDFRSRFFREAQVGAKIKHANVVLVYDAVESDTRSYIAMEYIDGSSLALHMNNTVISLKNIIKIVFQICSGLEKAHSLGIVHRDIKPSNILIAKDGWVKIADFGIARLAGAAKLTVTGSALGTPFYMSPEQASGEVVDQRSDIFSLGTILYELLTRQLPFVGKDEHAIRQAIIRDTPKRLVELQPSIPEDFQRIIDRAMAKNVEQRYQTVSSFKNDIIEAVEKQRKRKLKAQRSFIRPKLRQKYNAQISVLVVLTAAILTIFILASQNPEKVKHIRSNIVEMTDRVKGYFSKTNRTR